MKKMFLKDTHVWTLRKCMVAIATCDANLKNVGYTYKINYISAVANHSRFKLVPYKNLVIGLLSCGQIFKLSNLHIH